MTENEKLSGAFRESLKRNNAQIKSDRAEAIIDIAEMKYKRKVEDLEMSIKNMEREQDNSLDLSPSNATTLIVASDFDSDKYIETDLALGLKIRNEGIKLEIAKTRFKHLFGKDL